MSKDVYADGNAIACKAGDGKVVAAFPDVCMSPPPPPTGPVPLPYPNTSFSRDMKSGSRSVRIGGKEAMLRDVSYYKSSPLGNEAATRNFGASVLSHTITGKTYFAAWSMDVTFEGRGVCRHLDITTSNHASQPGGPASPEIEGAVEPTPDTTTARCDCCGKAAHSAAQADGNEMTEAEFYMPRSSRGESPGFAAEARSLLAEIRGGPCKNILPPAEPGPKTRCASYFVTTAREKATIERIWNEYKPKYMRKMRLPAGMGVSHRVAKAAGGCPTGWGNLTPTAPECDFYENSLARIQQRAITYHRKVRGIV